MTNLPDARTLAAIIRDSMNAHYGADYQHYPAPFYYETSDLGGTDLEKVATDVLIQLEKHDDATAKIIEEWGKTSIPMPSLADIRAKIVDEKAELVKLRNENAELKTALATMGEINDVILNAKVAELDGMTKEEKLAVFGARDPLIERLREENLAHEVEIELLEAEVQRLRGDEEAEHPFTRILARAERPN